MGVPPSGVGAGPGRFLLTGVVAGYHHDPVLNREELSQDLSRVVELFTTDFGYAHVPVLGLNPTREQIRTALGGFCAAPDRHPDDYLVIYLAGHGEVLQRGPAHAEHFFLPADVNPSNPATLRRTALKTSELADLILGDTLVRRLLLILDTCLSGQGILDVARQGLDWAGDPDRMGPDAGAALLWSTQPKKAALPGAFTTALVEATRARAVRGHGQQAIHLDAVMAQLDQDSRLKQRPGRVVLFGDPDRVDLLPNPISAPALVGYDMAEQDRRWQARLRVEHARRDEMQGRFHPRAIDFVGRHRALTDLTRWLGDPSDVRSRVVTGDPGSGKTSVLAVLAALSDPQLRPSVPRGDLPPTAVPDPASIDVAIYAGGLSAGQVLAGLAAAAGVEDGEESPDQLAGTRAAFLAAAAKQAATSGRPFTAVIDALDEAGDPVELAEQVLRPVQAGARGGVRLLLGTRRNVCPRLGPDWATRYGVLDLDAADYADPASIATTVRRLLLRAPLPPGPGAGSPFGEADPVLVRGIADAIASVAGHSFYLARIIATTQVTRAGRTQAIPDPHDPVWLAGLPRDAGQAMREDLELHLGDQVGRALGVLRPLAYAKGAGLPWEEVWPALASALSRQPVSAGDLQEAATHGGSYVVEAGALDDRSLYRLYHQSLADYLRHDRDAAADHATITRTLLDLVPRREDLRRDWPHAHPYTRAHLAEHAAPGGLLDDLVQDPGYLLAADRPALLAVLDTTTETPARAAADAYRRTVPAMRHLPRSDWSAYLGLHARCGHAGPLADRLIADGIPTTWQTLWASWRPQTANRTITGHTGPVNAVAVTDLDGRPVVISGSADNTVRVWDLRRSGPAVDDGLVIDVAAAVSSALVRTRTLLVAAARGVLAIELRPPYGLPVPGEHH